MKTNANNIIYFDGYCSFCAAIVRFIKKRDKNSVFSFVPLQKSRFKNLNTIVYQKDKSVFFKSTAVLMILKDLRGGFQFFYPLIFFPPFIRNFVYDLFVKLRYKIFGRNRNCYIPEN